MAEGLFGLTPDAVRRQMALERLGTAKVISSLGPGGLGALAGGQAGQAIGGLLGVQPTDPRLAQAQKLEQIAASMERDGIEPSTPGFSAEVGRRMMAAGMPQQMVTQAVLQAQKVEEGQQAIAEFQQGPIREEQSRRNYERALQGAGMPPDSAAVLSSIPEVADAVLKARMAPQADQVVQRAVLAATDPATGKVDQKELRRLIRQSFEKAPLVSIGDAASKVAATTRAKSQTEDVIAMEKAAPVLREYVALLQSPPPMTDIEGMRRWVAEVNARKGSAGQALARLRNPERVTDDDVRLAAEQLPGYGSVLTGTVGEAIEALNTEVGGALSGGGKADTSAIRQQIQMSLPPGSTIKRITKVK